MGNSDPVLIFGIPKHIECVTMMSVVKYIDVCIMYKLFLHI